MLVPRLEEVLEEERAVRARASSWAEEVLGWVRRIRVVAWVGVRLGKSWISSAAWTRTMGSLAGRGAVAARAGESRRARSVPWSVPECWL